MTCKNQATMLVGMDAHSDKISLCVTHWHHGSNPAVHKEISTTLRSLEATYRNHVAVDALTVLEASTNAFSIVERLRLIGFKATVITSDAVSGMARCDRINDRIDAYNLALAYSRGGTREVFVPSERFRQWRDISFGHNMAMKDTVRWSNRTWSFCSKHGLSLPKGRFSKKVESVKSDVSGHGWSDADSFHLDMLLNNYAKACETKSAYQKRIEQIVAQNEDMISVMQVLGIGAVVSFSLVTFIEDIKRFDSPKKLVSYIGLNPTVRSSGESSGTRRISRYGRRDLKRLLVESAKCAMRHGNDDVHNWARRKIASKKHINTVTCAVARKLSCYVWHILKGHPAVYKENTDAFRRKLAIVARALGSEGLAKAGYAKQIDYINFYCNKVYPQNIEESTKENTDEKLRPGA